MSITRFRVDPHSIVAVTLHSCQLQSLNLQILRLLRASSSLTFRQLWSVDSLWNAYVTWQEYTTQRTIFSEISQIFQSSCTNTFGWLFPRNKKQSRGSWPKEFLEIALLKYLGKLPGDYQWKNVLVAKIKKSTPTQMFSCEFSRIFSE